MKASWLICGALALLVVPCFAEMTYHSTRQTPSLGYVLQAEKLAKDRAKVVQCLAESNRDVLVIDADFSMKMPWTREDISTIRSGRNGRMVLAYLSIGEAEKYRRYWLADWASNPPSWLGKENPDWPRNYCVNYWDTDWQNIILATLDDILAAGFDGVYLDIVDAFEGFEHDPKSGKWRDHLKNPATGQSYRQDMVDWVRRIAKEAHEVNPRFVIIPQNGVQLLEYPRFEEIIDAVGVEDLFAENGRPVSSESSAHRLAYLHLARPKPVFVIEYDLQRAALRQVRENSEEQGFSLLVTSRELDELGVSFVNPKDDRAFGWKKPKALSY